MKKTTANDVYYVRRSFTDRDKYIVVMRINGIERQIGKEYPLYNTAWVTADRLNKRQGRVA